MKKNISPLIGGFLILALLAEKSHAVEPLVIETDQTYLLPIQEKASAIIIGNPTITDATIYAGKIFLQGRAFGNTNVLILNAEGKELGSYDVTVSGGIEKNRLSVFTIGPDLKMYERVTYNCAPYCEAAMIPWSNSPQNDLAITGNQRKSDFAKSASSPAPSPAASMPQ